MTTANASKRPLRAQRDVSAWCAVALYYLAAVGFSLILVADQAHLINPIDRFAASGPDPDVQLIGLTDHVVNQFSVGLIRHGCKQLQLLATMMCEGARADKT
jgi:hypothetical protein